MRYNLLLKKIVFLLILLFSFSNTNAQFSFGVSPGLNFNNAYFGYKIDNDFVPYVSFQFARISAELKQTNQDLSDPEFSNSSSDRLTAALLLPSVGLKYFITTKNDVKAYANLSLSRPMLISDDLDDLDDLSLFGAELGFGMEYFFSENFSVGGEYGVRYFHIYNESKNDIRNFDDQIVARDTEELNIIISPTYARISLNYYF